MRIKRRIATFLYVSGITRSGGMTTFDHDGIRDYLPPLRHVLPRRGYPLRPYLLGKPSWWWECHWRQRLTIRGRHTPIAPYALGICAACVPCPRCGAQYACDSTCELSYPPRTKAASA